jgi:hypothetical protein
MDARKRTRPTAAGMKLTREIVVENGFQKMLRGEQGLEKKQACDESLLRVAGNVGVVAFRATRY